MTYCRIDLTDEPEITHALFRLGKYIEKHGVRRDFDAAITDCYLGKDKEFSFTMSRCVMLREKLAGTDIVTCIKHSYNEIKDRKGTWKNGMFIKESDL